MEMKTTKCSTYGRPEFLIRCDDSIPEQDVEWLVALLEGSVREGVVYESGELVQVGWMLNMLSEVERGTLLLMEPDMRSLPIEWANGVTETLRHLRLQKDTAESVGLGRLMQIPTIRESGLLGIDVDANTEGVILERGDAADADSGWFVGRLPSRLDYNDSENLRRVSLYEAATLCPRIVMFMSLPVGTRVEYSPGRVSISREGSTIVPQAGSFLERLVHPQ